MDINNTIWTYMRTRESEMAVPPEAPALLTRMCNSFSSSKIRAANFRTDSSEEVSSRRRCTFWFPVLSLISCSAAVPRASLRHARITRAPRRAKSRAMNFPIPERSKQELNDPAVSLNSLKRFHCFCSDTSLE